MGTNNFTVKGFVVKDAEFKQVGKSEIARFGIYIKTDIKDKDGNKTGTASAPMWFERHVKADDTVTKELLKAKSLVLVTGFFKAEEWEKDGQKRSTVKHIAVTIEDGHKKSE